jgi:hypothetical protein
MLRGKRWRAWVEPPSTDDLRPWGALLTTRSESFEKFFPAPRSCVEKA